LTSISDFVCNFAIRNQPTKKSMKVEVMKQFRILLAIFLLWVGGAAVLAEEITDAQGITYETYTISGETGYFARITYAYSSDFSLTIPDKVTMANGSQATVTGFSKSFTCYCRNVSAIISKRAPTTKALLLVISLECLIWESSGFTIHQTTWYRPTNRGCWIPVHVS
jgi:hypothetical protein